MIDLQDASYGNDYEFALRNKIKSYKLHNWILEQLPDTSKLTSAQKKYI